MYIWGCDLSLACTGIAIFEDESPIIVFSIPTSPRKEMKERLKIIADTLLLYKQKYPPNTLVLERCFTRFNLSTQQIFRVHGLVNYLFYECEQIYYPPLTIKKSLTGSGKAKKIDIENCIRKTYPDIKFEDDNQADALAIGRTYFVKKT
jgi:Holliday junction resolvasome RuvABC endonuclease subunit